MAGHITNHNINKHAALIFWTERMVALVLILAPFHAFMTLTVSQFTGHFVLVRLWDELVVAIITAICLFLFYALPDLRKRVSTSWFFRLALLFIATTLISGIVGLLWHQITPKAFGYALIVNLRYLLWIFDIFVIASYSSWLKSMWKKIIFIPLGIVVVFGLLQFFVLPQDFLKQFGYNDTYAYVAVVPMNQDSPIMRIQSFLRGANPLGAYLACCLTVLLAVQLASKKKWVNWTTALMVLSAGALVLTFSRSAFLGLIASMATFGWYVLPTKRKLYVALVSVGLGLAVALAFLLMQSDSFKNAILHTNDKTTAETTSNEGHLASAQTAKQAFMEKPLFGWGPGSAGAASWYNTGHPIINTESFFLQILVEMGAFGSLIFAAMVLVLRRNLLGTLDDGLSLGVVTALFGAFIINLFSYGWTDDTLAYVWWGLAGIALGNTALLSSKNSLGRSGININRWLTNAVDTRLMPKKWRVDGMKDYVQHVVPPLVKEGMTIYDIGGGKRPFVGSEMAAPPRARIIGVDIDRSELERAPRGAYHRTIVADIGKPSGIKPSHGKADLVICEAVLEHVSNNEYALKNIADLTKTGGRIALFVPARNAAFAAINRVLPEKLKRKLLFSIFPESAHAQGFPAYYDKCTPSEFIKLCESNGFRVDLVRPYYQSTYFSFLFPAHIVWRIYQLMAFLILRRDAAESFTIVAVKK